MYLICGASTKREVRKGTALGTVHDERSQYEPRLELLSNVVFLKRYKKAAYPAETSTLQPPEVGKEYVASKAKTDRQDAPAEETLDSEVISFCAQFDPRSSLDEIVLEGARRMLQATIDTEVNDVMRCMRIAGMTVGAGWS